jgi:hypothetical protein
MNEIVAFFAEVRAAPKFIAAASRSSILAGHLDEAERILLILYHDGDTQPAALELFDRVRAAVSSKTHTIKQRLNQLEDLLREWKRGLDRGKQ